MSFWSWLDATEPEERTAPQVELGAAVRRVRILTAKLVDSALSGGFKSAFRGSGLEFREVRAYEHGDDVRRIDWNVTARTGSAYVKTYAEERELEIHIVLDRSRSLGFGTREGTKADAAARLVALVAFAAARSQDKVGLTVFDGRGRARTPCKKGMRQALQIVRAAMLGGSGEPGGLVDALETEERLLRRRSVLFLVSDFCALDAHNERLERLLTRLNRRHDVIAVRVQDPFERELPAVGPVLVRDLSTGLRAEVDGRDAGVRRAWSQAADERRTLQDALFARCRIEVLDITTDGAVDVPLIGLFRRRATGRAASNGGRA